MKTLRLIPGLLVATVLTTTFSASLRAAEIRVAVASNFTQAIKTLARQFETDTNHKVTLAFGSTGKHYAQIINGAPFDIFFAAGSHRPQLLEKKGIALPRSRFTYAIGKLVLWSPIDDYVDPEGHILSQGKFRYLAIGNPKLAPYGKAAQEILQSRGLFNPLKKRLIRGENIGQTYQFVKSGNAELGFVAWSQVKRPNLPVEGSYWEPPHSLYTRLEQQAVLLKDNQASRTFLAFIRSPKAYNIIADHGYDILNLDSAVDR